MNLIELSKLLLDEKEAEQYLLEKGILKTFTKCEKCGSTKLGRIRRGKYKCYTCKYEWGKRKDSILHMQKISASKFIGLIKIFALDISSFDAMNMLQLNRKTTDKIYHKIRLLISNFEENDLKKYKYFVQQDNPVFTITFNNGKIKIDIAKMDRNANSEFSLIRTRDTLGDITYNFDYTRLKSILYRDRLEKYPTEVDHYFRYVKEKLLKYRGIKLEYLYLYLKEIEFRYNYKNDNNFFDKIVNKIANN